MSAVVTLVTSLCLWSGFSGLDLVLINGYWSWWKSAHGLLPSMAQLTKKCIELRIRFQQDKSYDVTRVAVNNLIILPKPNGVG